MKALITTIILAICQTIAPTATGAEPVWKKDASKASIPEEPARGMANGEEFKVEDAKIRDGILSLRQGEDFFADVEFTIFLFLDEGTEAAGQKFKVAPDDGFGSPHVHWKFMVEGRELPEVEMFMDEYSMKLEFGDEADGKLPGKIYLCLPDDSKSFVAGTFEAVVEDPAPAADDED